MSSSPPSSGAEEAPSPSALAPLRFWKRAGWRGRWDWFLVIGAAVAYGVLIVYLSNLRAENFFTSTWDLGVNQQLLWSGAHGQLLLETPDLEFYNAHSFLQVHSTWVAFLVAPIYGAWPTPLTLFIVQSVVFSASALPLYSLARGTLQRKELALTVIGLYLSSFAVTSALMYDFHWEAFIPVEYLALFLLVYRQRYALALVPLVVGTLTLEVFPFLAGGVALLFLVERVEKLGLHWRPLRKDRTFRVMVGFLAVALAAYVLVRVAQLVLVPSVLNVASVTGGGPQGVGALFRFGATVVTIPHSLAYWFLMLATLAFLPFLSPRYFLLSVPWFYFSVFGSAEFSSHFGDSPALIAFPPLAIGAVFGLREVERWDWSEWRSFVSVGLVLAGSVFLAVLSLVPGGSVGVLSYSSSALLGVPAALLGVLGVVMLRRRRSPSVPPARPHRALPRRVRRIAVPTVIVAVVAAVIVFDTALSPFVPANFNATPIPGYEFRFGENPTAAAMPWITSFLPSGAQVLASDRLFPYVANNPNAWAVPWFVIGPANPVPNFPFTPSNLPAFVLADATEYPLIPSFLQTDLFNGSEYGLVAYVYATGYPGTIYLFEHGYRGATQAKDLASPPPLYEYSASNLSLGPAGAIASDPYSSFGQVIASTAAGPLQETSVNVWFGPYATFLPGNYSVAFRLEGAVTNASKPTAPLAYVDGTWEGNENLSTFFRVPINASGLSSTSWTTVTATLDLAYPYPTVELRGYLYLDNGRTFGSITLDSIRVTLLTP